VLGDQALQLLYDLAGSLNVAGATDANCDFQHVVLPLFVMFGGKRRAAVPPWGSHIYFIISQNREYCKTFDRISLDGFTE
jgi:hypothetical protein